MDKTELKTGIMEAFGDKPFPESAHLLAYKGCAHDECLYLERTFARRAWMDVADKEKPYRDDFFFCFSLEAYRYYLPSFMFIVLDHYEEADVMVNTFLHTLQRDTKSGLLDLEELSGGRLQLTQAQRIAIAHFLTYIYQHYGNMEACAALADGWSD